MRYLRLTTSGIEISAIVMGTWQAGKSMWSGIDDRESIRAIRAAFDAGVTTFDTAEEYGKGHSERILGEALKGARVKTVIASKVRSRNLEPAVLVEACNRSLENLSTDYMDLYQIHWPAGTWGTKAVPVSESIGALVRLREQGKIRAIGVSNFSVSQLEEAMNCGPIESLQPPYSLFWRQAEKELLPFCNAHGITVLAYSPMAQGFLTGRFGPGHVFGKKDHRRRNRLFAPENIVKVERAMNLFLPVADSLGVSPARLALAWVLRREGICAVAGARNERQARDNAAAADLFLAGDVLEMLDQVSAIVVEGLDDDMVQWR